MELQNKLRFFALFLFDYSVVTLFTLVMPIFFVFIFFIFLEGYSIRVTNVSGSHLKRGLEPVRRFAIEGLCKVLAPSRSGKQQLLTASAKPSP
jgi:hypothetical protein